MKIAEYKGFQIQTHTSQGKFYAEIYRRDILLLTIKSSAENDTPLRSSAAATQSAKDWIYRTYPKGKLKYFWGGLKPGTSATL